jgi:hypothetical protein
LFRTRPSFSWSVHLVHRGLSIWIEALVALELNESLNAERDLATERDMTFLIFKLRGLKGPKYISVHRDMSRCRTRPLDAQNETLDAERGDIPVDIWTDSIERVQISSPSILGNFHSWKTQQTIIEIVQMYGGSASRPRCRTRVSF